MKTGEEGENGKGGGRGGEGEGKRGCGGEGDGGGGGIYLKAKIRQSQFTWRDVWKVFKIFNAAWSIRGGGFALLACVGLRARGYVCVLVWTRLR